MSGWVWVIIALLVIILVIAVAYAAWKKRQSSTLQTKFGPEYDRTVGESDSRRQSRERTA